MLKLVLLVVGLTGGAAGTAVWLLSEPGLSVPPGAPGADRLNELKRRLDVAQAEGEVAGKEAENRIRHEFETFRLHPDRPGTSS